MYTHHSVNHYSIRRTLLVIHMQVKCYETIGLSAATCWCVSTGFPASICLCLLGYRLTFCQFNQHVQPQRIWQMGEFCSRGMCGSVKARGSIASGLALLHSAYSQELKGRENKHLHSADAPMLTCTTVPSNYSAVLDLCCSTCFGSAGGLRRPQLASSLSFQPPLRPGDWCYLNAQPTVAADHQLYHTKAVQCNGAQAAIDKGEGCQIHTPV